MVIIPTSDQTDLHILYKRWPMYLYYTSLCLYSKNISAIYFHVYLCCVSWAFKSSHVSCKKPAFKIIKKEEKGSEILCYRILPTLSFQSIDKWPLLTITFVMNKCEINSIYGDYTFTYHQPGHYISILFCQSNYIFILFP